MSYDLALRLLFDPDLREKLASGDLEDLPPAERDLLAGVDRVGLEIDAQARGRYLMSALCRSYPLTSAALGALRGAAPLEAFLASPHLFAPLAARTRAFGEHLQRLVALGGLEAPLRALLSSFLDLERGLVQSAAALRAAASRGEAPPPPGPVRASLRKRGLLRLPPFSLVVQLPVSTGVLRAALEGAGPEDAWARVRAGSLQPGRLRTVARAEPNPVTFLGRAFLVGEGIERAGAGGVAPLLEVRHRTLEVRGALARVIAGLEGQPWRDLPAPGQRLADVLLEAGLLAAEEPPVRGAAGQNHTGR